MLACSMLCVCVCLLHGPCLAQELDNKLKEFKKVADIVKSHTKEKVPAKAKASGKAKAKAKSAAQP